jgi:hypothetical protein
MLSNVFTLVIDIWINYQHHQWWHQSSQREASPNPRRLFDLGFLGPNGGQTKDFSTLEHHERFGEWQ